MSKARMSNRLRRAGRGSVAMIALLLISSGVVRLASGMAFARDTDAPAFPLQSAVTSEAIKPADPQVSAPIKPATSRDEMGGLLDALRAREARVAEQESQIEVRTRALQAADAEIAKRLDALEQAEAALRSTIALADGAAEDDLTRLTAVYESMKPKDAAALFETMEPGFAAGFLGRMRPDAAAAVMTGLSPDVAYSISVILAGRNANVPKT